jgi:hypothetical protein
MEAIPLSIFPEQNDVDRIMHLYSESAADESDTLQFWKRNILSYCLLKNTIHFKLSDISNYFTVHGIVPSSLLLCASKLHQQGLVVYPESLSRNSIVNYAISFISPVNKDSILVSNEVLGKIQAEILANISRQAHEDSIYMINGYDSIDDSSTFYSFLRSISLKETPINSASINHLVRNLSAHDLPILIDYLVRNKAAIISPDKSFIKLKSSSSSRIDITELDIAKVQLKRTISRLESRITELASKADSNHAEAVKYNRLNDKSRALFHLKVKKLAIEARDKVSSALLTLIAAAQVSYSP